MTRSWTLGGPRFGCGGGVFAGQKMSNSSSALVLLNTAKTRSVLYRPKSWHESGMAAWVRRFV